MHLLQSVASVTDLFEHLVALIGLIQSRGWLAGIAALLACSSISTVIYAQHQRARVHAASIEIEGLSIDCLNAANLRRRVNRTLVIQTVEETVTIDGADLEMTWRYAGYCRAQRETAIEFSVDSEHSIPFSQLDCFGYDLMHDPDKQHRIRPLLIGPESISKKIAVPFLEPLFAQQPFDIMLECRLPGTYGSAVAYYTSTLSFDQDVVGRCALRLIFRGKRPVWVRVYERAAGNAQLLKTLRPAREDTDIAEFLDIAERREAQSQRVYLFSTAPMLNVKTVESEPLQI
jgi:hypothetical protein